MVNYLSKFNSRLAELKRLLRELIKKKYYMGLGQRPREEFEDIKRLLTQAPVLAKFELRAEHRVTADCSHGALEAALLKRKTKGQ